MKRLVVVTVIALAASIAAGAAYKIQLKDGKVITADAKPIIHNDFAYFDKLGLYLYIPVSQIDTAKTEELNKAPEEVSESLEVEKTEDLRPEVKAKPVKPVFIDDEELQIIKKRSRLANEGELSDSPDQGPSASAGPRPGQAAGPDMSPQSSGGQVDQLRAQMNSLLGDRSVEQNRLTDLKARISKLQNDYNFSVMETDQARIQQQIDSTQSELTSVQARLSDLDSQIQSLQQQIANAPVVVQTETPPRKDQPNNK
jgi:DNA repair exonuclease SbcCD ATPase subunit